jgi:hypothetical protein
MARIKRIYGEDKKSLVEGWQKGESLKNYRDSIRGFGKTLQGLPIDSEAE